MPKPDFKTSVMKGVMQAQGGQTAPIRPSLAELANQIEAKTTGAEADRQQAPSPPPTKRAPQPRPQPRVDRKQPPVKDAFSCTKEDLKALDRLLDRSENLGIRASKSELLRAGILSLAETDDATFRQILMSVPRIKTGRPAKKVKAIDIDGLE